MIKAEITIDKSKEGKMIWLSFFVGSQMDILMSLVKPSFFFKFLQDQMI